MTREEFERRMAKISDILDPEHKHTKADELMAQALKDEGYEEGVEVFEEMNKWYS